MRFSQVVKWLRAIALSAVLLVPQSAPGLATAAAASAAGTIVFATPTDAWARKSSGSSSGGYSRPSSSSSSSRTPSASSGYSKPSSGSSGGYSIPRTPSSSSSTSSGSSSASDKAMSRQGSSDALKRYRDADKPATTAQPSTSDRGSGWSWTSGSRRGYSPSSGGSWSGWYGQRGWSPPRYASPGRGFGMWDALFLWFMLDSLTSPGHAAFFHNHQNDPGVREWRAEAERLAKDNKDLAAKLDQLDKSVAQMKGQPVDPNQLPPDVPVQVATGSTSDDTMSGVQQPAKSGGFGLFWLVVVLAAVLFLLWLARRRLAARKPKEDSVPLGTIGNFVSQKLSGKPYEPKLFRVGMTVTIDPTPFLLAAGLTKVQAPEAGLTSIPAVGTVTSGSAVVHRLYLPDANSFFQLHLDKDGHPTECRYFTMLDEVNPADEAEWGFWLDRNEGMIGWPEFQTKDGKVYQRAWTPGASRVAPFKMREELKDVRGSKTRALDAMLYAAPTGAAAPAPDKEYILVAAVEADGQAWVEIAAGIDVSPASLSLT